MAGNLLMSISQNEQERAIFRSHKKFQTDLQSDLATAEDNGERRGIAIGEKNRSIEIARRLLKMGFSLDQIVTATDLMTIEVECLWTGMQRCF